MSVSAIKDLDINPKIIHIILRARLDTFEKILCLSVSELILLTKLSKRDVSLLISAVSHACLSSTIVNAWNINQGNCPAFYNNYKISTGCSSIDKLLQGGIRTGFITEISGESSTGKTQFCVQLSLHVQLPVEFGGLNSGAAYICTEQGFPMKRFDQLVHVYQKKYASLSHNFWDNVFIDQIGDLKALWRCLKQDLPALLIGRNIKLVIIDSVAALFRGEFKAHEGDKRFCALHTLGILLRKLVTDHGVAVICVNQVTSVIPNIDYGQLPSVKPSLGLYWSNMITTRLMITRRDRNASSAYFHSDRHMKTLFSPYLPRSFCCFNITSNGLEDC